MILSTVNNVYFHIPLCNPFFLSNNGVVVDIGDIVNGYNASKSWQTRLRIISLKCLGSSLERNSFTYFSILSMMNSREILASDLTPNSKVKMSSA